VYDQCRAAYASDLGEGVAGGGGCVVPEVDFADPGAAVEEEGKPTDPGPELDVADCLNAGGDV
jgi:hypothetical protein